MVVTAFFISDWLQIFLCCIVALYAVVAALALFAARARSRRFARVRAQPVSVLKPLCGVEPRLFDNLATFCEQLHPCYQLLFGVSSAADPAVAIVERLQAAYPLRDISLIVDSRVYGQNLKVSNLINLSAHAKYEIIVIADSDIAVKPDYLEAVTAPLADPRVGVVTCLYRARSVGGFWARIGAMFINEWFVPSVYVAHALGSRRFGFGATLALRASVLAQSGGFAALKDCLADDYWLAEHARAQGLDTVLSDVVVTTDVIETTVGALWLRETRWLRTIRSINPLGFAFLLITFTSPWLFVSGLLAYGFADFTASPRDIVLACSLCVGLVARLGLHICGSPRRWRDLPLVPLRDALLALQWLAAVFGAHVIWRNVRVPVVGRASVVKGADGP